MHKRRFIYIFDRTFYKKQILEPIGFTLIELLIAIAIFTVVSVLIASFFVSLQQGYTTQHVTTDVLEKARAAMMVMSSDIKHAGLDPKGTKAPTTEIAIEGSDSNFKIVSAESKTITFDMDSDDGGAFNGTLELSRERIAYRFDNNRLLRFVGTPPDAGINPPNDNILVSSINSAASTFQYFVPDDGDITDADSEEDELSQPISPVDALRISSVRIYLVVMDEAGRSSKISRTLTNRIRLKNILFNAQR